MTSPLIKTKKKTINNKILKIKKALGKGMMKWVKIINGENNIEVCKKEIKELKTVLEHKKIKSKF